ncbi:MAG: ABC transporter substrate-binding protein [Deltaproteobacteria bacterium]|nr:ABC transporter substrate-binding protein [Deltaproteobacteria bacterium]
MTKLRRISWVTLLSILVVAVLGLGVAAAADDIRIGFTPPITGVHAAGGSLQVKSINLALKEINGAGGVNGKKIDLRIIDNQSTNPGALAALQKAVEQEKVLAMLGCLYSTQVFATADATKNYGIPTIIGATNVNITKQGNPWLFRVRPDDSVAAGAMVKYIKEDTKLTKIGLIHDADAFGTGGADLVEKFAKASGLTLVRREKCTTGAKDFTAELLAMKNAGAQVLIFYGHEEATAVLQRQLRQIGSPFKFLGSPSAASKDALNLAKEAAEGIWAVVDFVPGQSKENKAYADAYKKEYNADFDSLSVWTYDGLKILANAIQKAGEDRAKIREAILATQGYKGAQGTFSFTPNGDGLSEVSIVQIEKGQQKLLKIVNVGSK